MAKLEKAESECKGLMDKWAIIENDKKSLKQVRRGPRGEHESLLLNHS